NKTLVPTMSMLQTEIDRMRTAFLNYMSALAFLLVPACVGMALVSGPFLRVVLGEQWVGGTLVMQILALFAILRSGILAIANALVGLGRPMVSAQLAWINVGLLLVGGLALAPNFGVTGIASARLFGGVIVALFACYTVAKLLQCRLRNVLRCYVRPVLCACVMAPAVIAVARVSEHALVVLIVQVIAGAAVYTVASFVVWHWIGRPDGGERLLVEQLARIRAWRPAQ
ncbi:MAG TPA: polysaccharide biosynthesis C-terminal domain-containing protein, partial [Rudaea sp.]